VSDEIYNYHSYARYCPIVAVACRNYRNKLLILLPRDAYTSAVFSIDGNSDQLFFRLSVRCVRFDKAKEPNADILLARERVLFLVFRYLLWYLQYKIMAQSIQPSMMVAINSNTASDR